MKSFRQGFKYLGRIIIVRALWYFLTMSLVFPPGSSEMSSTHPLPKNQWWQTKRKFIFLRTAHIRVNFYYSRYTLIKLLWTKTSQRRVATVVIILVNVTLLFQGIPLGGAAVPRKITFPAGGDLPDIRLWNGATASTWISFFFAEGVLFYLHWSKGHVRKPMFKFVFNAYTIGRKSSWRHKKFVRSMGMSEVFY